MDGLLDLLAVIASLVGYVVAGVPCSSRPVLPTNTHEYFPGSLDAPIKSPPYPDNHRMYFHCNNNEGLVDVNTLWWDNLLTCKNGSWSREYESHGAAVCKRSHCTTSQKICRTGKCIDASKWCNCIPDCDEGEDEDGCGAIRVDVAGSQSGSVRNLFFQAGYPGNIDCTINITTSPGKRIGIRFPTMDLGGTDGSLCRDFVSLSNVEYSQRVLCYDANCAICNKLDFGVTSKGNWFGVRLVTKGDSPGNTGVIIDWTLGTRESKQLDGGTDGRKANMSKGVYIFIIVATIAAIISSIVISLVVKSRKKRVPVPQYTLLT